MPGAGVIAESVSRAYDRSDVLHEVSFAIEPGELVALTGPSGSGKTTLLQLIGSLDRPTGGRILVDGVDVGELRRPALFRRNKVGFVFQLHYLLPTLSAQQNVELPLAAAHVPRRERANRAREVLGEVGLADRAGDLPAELSGGERQRVAIARALANEPPLVLADEPTGALDTAASRQVWRLLSDVRARRGTTVIIASHDVTLGEHVDRSLHLVDGRLTEPGETRDPVPGRAG
ncbi:MAG TPA: ABC transporter ATP-binding protein [Solirubrobacteraceae bacterium]|jgi:ABC-type lipoprotein export system ATPase subunit|nr:ABC transporter ATP-binding protein [Solirubrobacteraceae bacterium]